MSTIIEYCELLDKVAELEHLQWSHWTRHFLEFQNESNRKHWERQAHLPYSKLTEKEKEADRKWARKVLDVIYKEINIKQAFKKQIDYVMINNLRLSATQIVTILKIVQEELECSLKKLE